MHTSATAIWIIVVVAVVALAIWLIAVMRADRKPSKEPHGDNLRGPVRGGAHAAAGGRSVAPRRDEEVTPDQFPDGDADNGEPDSAEPGPEHARRGSGNPLDL
jgi:hypothetical protein